MNAGSLTEVIGIYSPHIFKNEVGEQETEYILKYTTKANKINVSGSRDLENHEVTYNYIKTFEIRIYNNVDEFDRIKYKDKFYRILNIDTNRELQKITIQTELVNE